MSQLTFQMGDGLPAYGDKLRVHLVPLDRLALDWLEGAGSDMEGHLLSTDSLFVDRSQHLRREMEAGGGRRYRSLDLRIDRLIGLQVALLGGSM